MLALALSLSIAALLVGPALAHWAQRSVPLEMAIEGLTLGFLPALILVRLLPELAVEVGPLTIAAFAAAYLAFAWIERCTHDRSARMGTDFVTAALAAHSLADGAALAVAFDSPKWVPPGEALLLVGALVMHRAAEGLFVASTLVRAVGMRATLRRLGLLAAATLLGALGGSALVARVPDVALGALVAAGLGIMLRVVVHRRGDSAGVLRAQRLGVACFVVSAALFLVLPRAQGRSLQAPPSQATHEERR